MAAKSFKQMVSTKEIRRADAYKVRLEDLHEEPGLNWRRYTDAFHKSVEELAELIAGGMEVDPLEVRPREEGGVWIVTGHRRTRAWRLLDLSGRLQRDPKTGEFLVSVVPSKAKDRRQRLARVSTSQDQFELTPLDYAEGCRRMHEEEGMTPAEIAAEIKKTRQRVEQFLKLSTAS
ncbi:TPA: ParB/RepB/Spo0J family partition protein [Pseudomonas aeruginosa]